MKGITVWEKLIMSAIMFLFIGGGPLTMLIYTVWQNKKKKLKNYN
jgi:hypothetical protein